MDGKMDEVRTTIVNTEKKTLQLLYWRLCASKGMQGTRLGRGMRGEEDFPCKSVKAREGRHSPFTTTTSTTTTTTLPLPVMSGRAGAPC